MAPFRVRFSFPAFELITFVNDRGRTNETAEIPRTAAMQRNIGARLKVTAFFVAFPRFSNCLQLQRCRKRPHVYFSSLPSPSWDHTRCLVTKVFIPVSFLCRSIVSSEVLYCPRCQCGLYFHLRSLVATVSDNSEKKHFQGKKELLGLGKKFTKMGGTRVVVAYFGL